jgi:Protein of unknown function (DUF2889)
MTPDTNSARFDRGPILPPDPASLAVLHEREYRVRAYRLDRPGGPRLLLRGAVRDQKPAGLYVDSDPDPLTIHHMQVELWVAFPSMEITAASVLFEAHPHDACGSIAPLYGGLVGLSIARGFTHEVRQRFGGPRGCTHTTALLLAMAPVAIQSIWSMQVVEDRHSGRPWQRPREMSIEERRQRWAASLNSCHVWNESGEFAQHVLAGGDVDLPIPIRRRFDALGVDPFADDTTALPASARLTADD